VPFDDPSPTSVALQHLTMAPPSPSQINPSLNPETDAVLLKALSKQPEDRYRTGSELMNALEWALCAVSPNYGDQDGGPALPLVASGEPICPDPVGISDVSVAERVALHFQDQVEPSGQAGTAAQGDWPGEQAAGLQSPSTDLVAPTEMETMSGVQTDASASVQTDASASVQTDAVAIGQPSSERKRVRWMLYVLLGLVVLGTVIVLSAVGLYVTSKNVRVWVGRVLSLDLPSTALAPSPDESPLGTPAPGQPFVSPLTATVGVAPTQVLTATPALGPTETPTVEPAATRVSAHQLRLSVSAVPAVVKRHGELAYTIHLASQGGPIHDVVITSAIPANTEYVADSVTRGGVWEEDVIRWIVPEVAADESREFSFHVTVLSGDQVLNERYGARCDECVSVSGPPVVTPVESGGVEVYLPLIFRGAE